MTWGQKRSQAGSTNAASPPASDWLSCAIVIGLGVTVAVSSTTGMGIASSWFDEQRIVLLVALATAAFLALVFGPACSDKASAALLTALALGLLSAWFAHRPFVAAVDWAVCCLVAFLTLTARAPRVTLVETAAAYLGTIIPTAYVAGVMANLVSALLLDVPVGADTLLVGFSNPRFPAQLQVLTIPLLPLALAKAPSAFWRAGLVVVACLWWMCFVGSGSRTGWIAIALAAFVAVLLGAQGQRWLKTQLAFAIGGLLLWILLFHLLPALLGIEVANESDRFSNFSSVGARWRLWQLSIDAAFTHPFLGLGPMHFAYINNGEGAHPHNFWLQVAAEWGIPAASLVVSFTVAFLLRLWRTVRVEEDGSRRWIGVALLAAVTAWFIGSLADGYMVVPTSQGLSTAVLMLAVMWLRSSWPAAPTLGHGQFLPIGAAAFCAVALTILAALPVTEFGQPTRREQLWRAEHPTDMMWPRFWQQGWIGPDADPTAR